MDSIGNMMKRTDLPEDMPIQASMVSKAIESAQRQVESVNFAARKNVLEYDDVMNQQREVIYSQRRKVLMGDNLRDNVLGMIHEIIAAEMNQYCNEKLYPEEWSLDDLIQDAEQTYAPEGRLKKDELEAMSRDEVEDVLKAIAEEAYHQRELLFGEENMRELEKVVMLRVVDNHWMEHLDRMDLLREGIGLRAYGQRNPLVEYKIEAFNMFEEMISGIQDDIAKLMFRVSIVTTPQPEDRLATAQASHGDDVSAAESKKTPVRNDGEKIGRNDPCPCGSGKKYKNCCGANK